MSNVQVLVHWERPTVFAGEEVLCAITFKNVATGIGDSRRPSPNRQSRGLGILKERWKSDLSREQKATSPQPTSLEPCNLRGLGHRSTLSLNANLGSPQSASAFPSGKEAVKNPAESRGHRRSVSIVSVSTASIMQGRSQSLVSPRQRPSRHHSRAPSFQDNHRGPNAGTLLDASPSLLGEPGVESQGLHDKPLHSPPLASHPSNEAIFSKLSGSITQKYNGSSGSTWKWPGRKDTTFQDASNISGTDSPSLTPGYIPSAAFTEPNEQSSKNLSHPVPSKDQELTHASENPRQFSHVLSPASINGTPRSSMDFFTMTNNSTETLASEYIASGFDLKLSKFVYEHPKAHSASAVGHNRLSETLMMGYAQLIGSFSMDGSLINLTPFEPIKRRAVIGGQGSGGVVGIETSKKDNGIFGALNWGSIGESLGGLLGNSELSSIREMKGIASTKSIPILSTPQSILFVDLNLAPGESKSYTFRHILPLGIPPTHKGRAMKVTYQLVVGTQRPQSTAQQHLVRHVEIPFKVLPSINDAGDTLGHDLMYPHIILKNSIRHANADRFHRPQTAKHTNEVLPKLDEFQYYAEKLLNRRQENLNLGLTSPTEPVTPSQKQELSDDAISMKDRIDFAILRSNSAASLRRNANRFDIQRGGQRIAMIILARPAYRLGDTVFAVIDFQDATVPCYSLHISIETSEVIDSAIALRSSASIYRATRRIHASWSESCICARRAVFSSTIPVTATPEFVTSGVQLEWKIRFEFVTASPLDENSGDGGTMEQLMDDNRGKIMGAVRNLSCERFDVAVPIRVYGSLVGVDENTDTGYFSI